MKFSIAKLPKTFAKRPKKGLNAKKNQRIRLIPEEKSKYKFLLRWKKSFFTWQIQRRYYGMQGGALPSILVY